MRILIPLVLLLVFGLLVWLLAPWERSELEDPPSLAGPPETAEEESVEPAAPRLESERGARAARERSKKPRWPVVSSDAIGTGSLEVVPVGEDGEPISVDRVQVDLHRKGAGLWAKKLPSRDAKTKVWRFDGVPWGQVEVHVYGEYVRHTVEEAFVPKDAVEKVRVQTRIGGAIAYAATLRDGSKPKDVTVRLISPRARRAIPVHARSKGSAGTNPPMLEWSTDADGQLFAVPPGTYRLEATSHGGSEEVYTVTVEAGRTTELQIVFAY